MRVLWLGTKPPWPCVDGGRLLAFLTLEALRRQGVDVEGLFPFDPRHENGAAIQAELDELLPTRLIPSPLQAPAACVADVLRRRIPFAVARHRHPMMLAEVERVLAQERFDVVHVEQLQALAQAAPAFAAGVPVVLRCQNVESDLLRARAGVRDWPARVEGRRLARFEGASVGHVAAAVALTTDDAARLAELAAEAAAAAAVHTVAAPFPGELPAATKQLAGDPAVVLVASGGWHPNDDATLWCLREIWPVVAALNPGAVLHVFGNAPSQSRELRAGDVRIVWTPELVDSRDAFAPGAIHLIPLRIASGVRMRILEAWARGIAVVATPAAVRGMGVGPDREVYVAASPHEMAEAVRALHADPSTYAAVVTAGRDRLRQQHDPGAIAAALVRVYEKACDG